MTRFITRLFGRRTTPAKPAATRTTLGLESLDAREMPALGIGHALSHAMHSIAHLQSQMSAHFSTSLPSGQSLAALFNSLRR